MTRLFALILVLSLALAGCAFAEEAAPAAAGDAAPTAAEETASPNDILAAMEVYKWFVMEPLEVDESVPSPDGTMYLVKDETLRQASAMQLRLDTFFSTEISQSLWAWGAYQNVDGLLYGYRAEDSPLARPVDPSIVEIAYKVVSQTYKKRVYNAILYDTADGSTVYEFVSEYIGGRWIFTEFPFIW